MSAESFYVALPNASSPRICFNPNDGESMRSAFTLYRPHSVKGKIFKFLGQLLIFTRLVRYLAVLRLDEAKVKELDSYRHQIANALKLESIQIAFLKGTPGLHQKWIARISHNNKLIGFAKIACTTAAEKQLQIEAGFLKRASEFENNNIKMPRLLASIFSDLNSFIIVTAPECGAYKEAPTSLSDVLASYSAELSIRGGVGENSIEATLNEPFSLSGIPRIELLRARMKNWLSIVFEDDMYACAFAHGDFAPWNVLTMPENKSFVFDWEYASDDMPVLFDVFHYIFMPAMLINKVSPVAVVKYCLDACESKGLVASVAEALSIDSNETQGYLALYLWKLLIRLADTQDHANKTLGSLDQAVEYVAKALDCLSYQFNRRDNKLAVLVSAYACDPEHGSEPGVGWRMVQTISACADVWVITRKNNRESIERELLVTGNLCVYISGLDVPTWLGWWKRGGRGIRTYYYLWQLVALFYYRTNLQQLKFDIAHHITFVNDWIFSFLALTDLKFIWGPIGSHPKIPIGLTIDKISYLKDMARYFFQCTMRTIDPLFWVSAIRASKIIVISSEVKGRWPLVLFKEKIDVHTGIGVEEYQSITSKVEDKPAASTRRLLSIGRLVQIKGFNLTIEAFARVVLSNANVELVIIGEGSQKEELVRLASKLGVYDKIRFINWLPRDEVLHWFGTADIFLFPSFEAGGMVTLEAMCQSVPVVCLDYAGPGTMVDETSGVKVQISSKENVVNDLSEAILDLLNNDAKREVLAKGAKRSIEQKFMWNKRINVIQKWYAEIVSSGVLDKKI